MLKILAINNRHAIVSDDFTGIKKGDKMIGLKSGEMRRVEMLNNSPGFITGLAFLWFRPEYYGRFLKYVTQRDLEKLTSL
jgi:hypothetical protein